MSASLEAAFAVPPSSAQTHANMTDADPLALAALAELQHLYRTAPLGLALLDCNMRYVRINNRLAALNGRPAADHVSRTIRDMVPAFADRIEALVRQVTASGEPLEIEGDGATPGMPEEHRYWTSTFIPLRRADGTVSGVSVDVIRKHRCTCAFSEVRIVSIGLRDTVAVNRKYIKVYYSSWTY